MTLDRLSAKFAALADPTRRAILARLVLGETSVTELAEGDFPIQLGYHASYEPTRAAAVATAVARSELS